MSERDGGTTQPNDAADLGSYISLYHEFDLVGNILGVDSIDGRGGDPFVDLGVTQYSYRYDKLDQLVYSTAPRQGSGVFGYPEIRWSYDDAGNRISERRGALPGPTTKLYSVDGR